MNYDLHFLLSDSVRGVTVIITAFHRHGRPAVDSGSTPDERKTFIHRSFYSIRDACSAQVIAPIFGLKALHANVCSSSGSKLRRQARSDPGWMYKVLSNGGRRRSRTLQLHVPLTAQFRLSDISTMQHILTSDRTRARGNKPASAFLAGRARIGAEFEMSAEGLDELVWASDRMHAYIQPAAALLLTLSGARE
jgi:hypothetical protein